MSISKKSLKNNISDKVEKPLKQATLCFLRKNTQVLLAMKKRGFGVGKFNGVGGKRNLDETIEEAAKREMFEEIGVVVENVHKAAVLDCYFPENPNLGQQVTVFLVDEWTGEPAESEEMAPTWFDSNKIPYDKMWPDELFWLPEILKGKTVRARLVFGANDTMLEKKIETS